MSFSGTYATLAARADSNSLAQVLEVTLNSAQWNPGSGTLTTAMNLSDRACRARAKAYDPRIVAGGWEGGVRQEFSLRAAGLVAVNVSVTVADADNRVRNALIAADQRFSAARIYRVIHGSDTAYDSRFAGLLDSWEFEPGQVRLNLKTDERVLRSYHPRWPYLRSEWFQMSPEDVGKYAALVYGKHDGTGIVDNVKEPHGMVPTVPVWLGANSWYATNLAPAALIKDVYVDGVLSTPTTAWLPVYGSLAGGKIFTIIEFQAGQFPATDAVVTANVYGYPAQTGLDVITNPVEQIRHFIVNFGVDQTRGYTTTAWNTIASIIDSSSWDTAATWADARGLEGSRFLQDQRTVLDTFNEWLESFPMFRAFWNTEGKIELAVLSTQWPGYWDESSPVISREDGVENSFRYELDPSDVTRRVGTSYLYDSVQNRFLRTLDVEDPSVTELADSTHDMYWSPARIVA